LKRKIVVLGLMLLFFFAVRPSGAEAQEEPQVSIKHGERTFTFANGSFVYGVLRYSVDAVFKIYGDYSVVMVNETVAFFPLYAEYGDFDLELFSQLAEGRFGYLTFLYDNETTKHPIANITLVGRHTLLEPIVYSNSSSVRSYFLLAPMENESIEPNRLYAKLCVTRVNYTDPAVTYFSHVKGFDVCFTDGARWSNILPEGWLYSLVDFKDLGAFGSQNISMNEDVVFDGLPLKMGTPATWYTGFYAHHVQVVNELNDLRNDYVALLGEKEKVEEELALYKTWLPLAFAVPTIIGVVVVVIILRKK